MGFVDGVALVIAGLILLEFLILILAPGGLLSFAKWMARHSKLLMSLYLLLGLGLLYYMLRFFTLIEIVAAGTVMMIFYGIMLLPFYDRVVELFDEAHENGELWRRLGFGLVLWILIALAVFAEWFGLITFTH